MKQLWAPWRVAYVTGPRPAEAACIFCDAPRAAPAEDRVTRIVYRGAEGYLILNRYPYNSGHLMAVPYRHVARLDALTPAEAGELMHLAALAVRGLEQAMAPQGFNIGFNLGHAAGAGIDEHLHLHIVPRWVGDTNFMPVLGDVKVIPEHLDESFARLAAAIAAAARGRR
jgi:ATP adenylyltransferase